MESRPRKAGQSTAGKKHILESMLYMCELNKKKVLVCNQIFDINNEYDLNLYDGDTLVFKPF